MGRQGILRDHGHLVDQRTVGCPPGTPGGYLKKDESRQGALERPACARRSGRGRSSSTQRCSVSPSDPSRVSTFPGIRDPLRRDWLLDGSDDRIVATGLADW